MKKSFALFALIALSSISIQLRANDEMKNYTEEDRIKMMMEKKLMESIVNQMHIRGKIDNNQYQIAQNEIKKIIQ